MKIREEDLSLMEHLDFGRLRLLHFENHLGIVEDSFSGCRE